KRGRVGGLDDDLEVGIAGLDIIQDERVHRAFIGNQVEVGVDAFLRRMGAAVRMKSPLRGVGLGL
ncbi:MAG: hypothetical protein WA419_10120, partial [Silvibacterium sp.]